MVAIPVPAHARDSGGQRDCRGRAGGAGLLFLHAGCRDQGGRAVCRHVGRPARAGAELYAASCGYQPGAVRPDAARPPCLRRNRRGSLALPLGAGAQRRRHAGLAPQGLQRAGAGRRPVPSGCADHRRGLSPPRARPAPDDDLCRGRGAAPGLHVDADARPHHRHLHAARSGLHLPRHHRQQLSGIGMDHPGRSRDQSEARAALDPRQL